MEERDIMKQCHACCKFLGWAGYHCTKYKMSATLDELSECPLLDDVAAEERILQKDW